MQHGLKYVDGDIVADDSYFVWERYGEGWSQDDLAREWGAPVSALTVNDNVIFVNIMPADRPGERAFLNITPFPEYYKIDNRVMTTPAGSGPRTVSINREPGSNQLTFWGNIPQDDPGFGEALAIEDPADFTARLFQQIAGAARGDRLWPRAHPAHRAGLDADLQRYLDGFRRRQQHPPAESHAAWCWPATSRSR